MKSNFRIIIGMLALAIPLCINAQNDVQQQIDELKGKVDRMPKISGFVQGMYQANLTDEGELWMNTALPSDYNTEAFIDAATKIQYMFQNYTTPDAVGGAYENAAANFFTEETAIIANGPWMVNDFYDLTMVDEDFADKIGVAMYPGAVMYNSGKIGWQIGAKDEKELEAALTYVKFMTSVESQLKMLEMTGDTPAADVESDNVPPLVNETTALCASAKHNINDFQSLWYANVVDEISVQYPLLAQGMITPEEFAQALTDTAAKN